MYNQLFLTYLVIGIFAVAFLAWLYTKLGKKWLKNL